MPSCRTPQSMIPIDIVQHDSSSNNNNDDNSQIKTTAHKQTLSQHCTLPYSLLLPQCRRHLIATFCTPRLGPFERPRGIAAKQRSSPAILRDPSKHQALFPTPKHIPLFASRAQRPRISDCSIAADLGQLFDH